MIRLPNLRHPRDKDDAEMMRLLAGRMMQHHVNASWWDLPLKVRTWVGACSYAKRSLEWRDR